MSQKVHGMSDGQKELLNSLKSRSILSTETVHEGSFYVGGGTESQTATGIEVRTIRRLYENSNVVGGTLVAPAVVVRGLDSRGLIEIVGMDYSNPKFHRFIVRLVK